MKTDMKLILAAFLVLTIIQIYAKPDTDPLNVWKPYFGKNVKKSIKNDKPEKPKTETVKVVSEDKKDNDDNASKDDSVSDEDDDDNNDVANDSSDENDDIDDSSEDDDASNDDDNDSSEDASTEDTDDDDEDSDDDDDESNDDESNDDDKDDDAADGDKGTKKKSEHKKGDDAKKQKTEKAEKDTKTMVKPSKKSADLTINSIKMDRTPDKKKNKSNKTKSKGKSSKPTKKKPTNPNQGPKGEKGDRGPKGEPGDGSSSSIPMQAALSTVLTNHFGPAKDTIVPFDLVLLDLGDNYDNDTGIFICTIPGTYVVSLYLMSHPGAKVNARIYINNRPIAALWADDNKNVGFYPSSSIQTVTPLEFGDQVYVMLVDGGYGESWVHANYNAFTVYLLYEDSFMKKRR